MYGDFKELHVNPTKKELQELKINFDSIVKRLADEGFEPAHNIRYTAYRELLDEFLAKIPYPQRAYRNWEVHFQKILRAATVPVQEIIESGFVNVAGPSDDPNYF